MKKLLITFLMFNLYSILFAVVPTEIAKTDFFSIREYKNKSLELKRTLQISDNQWQYTNYYWKVHYNSSNKILCEKLYERGRLISYWSYLYQTDGRIIRKNFYWGGIRGAVYYDMGWKNSVLKRGFSFYNGRFKYEVYDSKKQLLYEEFYKDGQFDHFARYYYDSSSRFLRVIRSHHIHLRGRHYDYIYSGQNVKPYSIPRTAEEGSGSREQEEQDRHSETR
jgi:hypothetical protein